MPAHELMGWLQVSQWHYCLRLPYDALLHGPSKYPTVVGALYPPLGAARLYRQVRLWADGTYRCNLVLATVKGAKESWAVVTDEPPSLQTMQAIRTPVTRAKNYFWIVSRGPLS